MFFFISDLESRKFLVFDHIEIDMVEQNVAVAE